MSEQPYVGRRLKRLEDPRFLRGVARYTDDLPLPGALRLAVLRSPFAHARIARIDTAAAERAPGVVAVLFGEAVKELCPPIPVSTTVAGMFREPRWPLAIDVARFVGDPVAAVVAESPAAARDALELIDVVYEPVPAASSLDENQPPVYTDCPTNVAFEYRVGNGWDGAADHVVRLRVENRRVHPVPMEPRTILARYEPVEQSLTIHVSTQMPHRYRNFVADAFGARNGAFGPRSGAFGARSRDSGGFGVAEHRLRVVAPEVGGAFGAKCELYPEEMLAIGWAIRLGRPVRWVADRREEFATLTQGRGQVAEAELGLDAEGGFVGLRARVRLDLGAYYQLHTALPAYDMSTMASGPYRIPRVEYLVQGVFTHRTPPAAYRGVGRAEATYLLERLVDVAARRLGVDPVELRRRNLLAPSDFPYRAPTGPTYDSGDYAATLEKALEASGYRALVAERDRRRAEGRLAGIGLCCYTYLSGLGLSRETGGNGWESCTLRVERSGTVTVLTGISPHGQGEETSFAQIVADGLGVRPEQVAVVHGDTATVPHGIGSYGSRGLAVGGGGLKLAIDRVVEKARRVAAYVLEAAPEDVESVDGRFRVRGVPDRSLSLAEVARAAYLAIVLPSDVEPGLSASLLYHPENLTYTHGTHVCLAEVDRETGEVSLERYVAVDDCGRVVSPLLVDGQVHGGLAQGIGQALFEEMVYDAEGGLGTATLMDYALMTAAGMPRVEALRTETPSPHNPLGAKGIGEAGAIAAPPTVVSAVCDALGVDHLDMPLTRERVWRALR
ncbi:MAG TPA: xanthine dehydrogenase family protein molybdopterin-binding subunit [Chloroflexota bacterium]